MAPRSWLDRVAMRAAINIPSFGDPFPALLHRFPHKPANGAFHGAANGPIEINHLRVSGEDPGRKLNPLMDGISVVPGKTLFRAAGRQPGPAPRDDPHRGRAEGLGPVDIPQLPPQPIESGRGRLPLPPGGVNPPGATLSPRRRSPALALMLFLLKNDTMKRESSSGIAYC